MPSRILVPVDGSPQSRKALKYAFSHYGDATIQVLNVKDPLEMGYAADPMGGAYWEGWVEYAEEHAEAVIQEAEEIAADYDATVETAVEMGPPARTIVAFADDHEVDAIVMGSHGRTGVSRILLGSVAETVVRRAPVPVTVVR